MRASNRSAKPRKQWRLLRRAEQARRAADRIKTNERVRRYTREARRKGADQLGILNAMFRGVYEDAFSEALNPLSRAIFDALPLGDGLKPELQYVEAELPPLPDGAPSIWMTADEIGETYKEPIRMTIPEGWEPAVPDDEKPEWPFRWKPKAWLAKRGFKRLLPEPWP